MEDDDIFVILAFRYCWCGHVVWKRERRKVREYVSAGLLVALAREYSVRWSLADADENLRMSACAVLVSRRMGVGALHPGPARTPM